MPKSKTTSQQKNQEIGGNTLRSNKSVYRNRQSVCNRPVRRCRPPKAFDPSPAVRIPAEENLVDPEVETPVQEQPVIPARIIVPQAGPERENRRRGIQTIPSSYFMSLLNRPTTAFPVEQEEELDRLPKTSPPPTKSAAAKRAAPVEDSLRYSSILGSSNALRQIQIEVDQPIKRTEDLFRRPLPPPVAVPEETPSPPAQPTSSRSPRSENTTPSNRSISTPTTTCPTPRQSQSPHYPIMRLDSPAIQALLAPGPSQQSTLPKISNINNIRFIKQNRNSRSSLQKLRPAAYSYYPYSEEAGPSRQSASLMTKSCRAVSEPNTINLDTVRFVKQNGRFYSSIQKSGPVVYNFPPLHNQNHYFEEAGPSRVRSSSIPTDSQPPIYPVDVEEMFDEINSQNSSASSTGLPAALSRQPTPSRTEVIPEEVPFMIGPAHPTSSIVQNPPEAAAATNPLPKSSDTSPQPTTSTSNEVPPPAPGQAISHRDVQNMPNIALKREPGVTNKFKEEIVSAEAINRAMYLRYALEPSTHEYQLCVDLIENVGSYHRMRVEYRKLLNSLDSLEKEILDEEYKKGQKKRLAAQEELRKITAQRNQMSSEYEFDFWISGVSSNREKEDAILVELEEIDLIITTFEGAAKKQKDAEIDEKKRALMALEKVIIEQEANVLRFKNLHD